VIVAGTIVLPNRQLYPFGYSSGSTVWIVTVVPPDEEAEVGVKLNISTTPNISIFVQDTTRIYHRSNYIPREQSIYDRVNKIEVSWWLALISLTGTEYGVVVIIGGSSMRQTTMFSFSIVAVSVIRFPFGVGPTMHFTSWSARST
jgi:hypothetical protein